MIFNAEKITEITMHPTAHCKCQIGKDWYTNRFTVVFCAGDYYPDYMIVSDWISKNIEGKELNIEHAVNLLYIFLMGYHPASLSVTSDVSDASTHFPVSVTKKSD